MSTIIHRTIRLFEWLKFGFIQIIWNDNDVDTKKFGSPGHECEWFYALGGEHAF